MIIDINDAVHTNKHCKARKNIVVFKSWVVELCIYSRAGECYEYKIMKSSICQAAGEGLEYTIG